MCAEIFENRQQSSAFRVCLTRWVENYSCVINSTKKIKKNK